MVVEKPLRVVGVTAPCRDPGPMGSSTRPARKNAGKGGRHPDSPPLREVRESRTEKVKIEEVKEDRAPAVTADAGAQDVRENTDPQAPKTKKKVLTEKPKAGQADKGGKDKVRSPKEDPNADKNKMESDEQLVQDVRGYMKMHKLSQVTVGQEARISQAVISQWLSLEYHGHNDKVRAQSCGLTAGGTGCSQDACTRWPLQQAGGRNSPTPTTPTVRQTWSVGPMWWRAGWGCTRVAHFGRCAHGSHHGSHHRGRPVSSAGGCSHAHMAVGAESGHRGRPEPR